MLLNGTPFAFVIDLAALASRREYLKLDKWLTDKIREHGVSLQIDESRVVLKYNDKDCWGSCLSWCFTILLCVLSGTFYPGMCDIPEEALPIHYGGSGTRQGPAQKRPAAP